MMRTLGVAVTILLLHLFNVHGTTLNNPIDLGCQIDDTNRHLFRFIEDNSFNLSFFITPEDPISFQISFVGKKENQDNDLFILRPDSGLIQRKRHGESKTDNVTPKKSIPVGWNNITITMHNNTLGIGNYYTLTGFEFEINEIFYTAKHLTDCASKTPMWKIDKSILISIPLIGLSNVGIRLYSDQTFNPNLILNNLPIPLSYDEELVIRQSNEPLPRDDYKIEVKKVNNTVSIYTITKPEKYGLLMKANIKEDFENLIVSSTHGEYFLILDPFQQMLFEEECTIRKRCHETQNDTKDSPKHEIRTKTAPLVDNTSKCNCSSSIMSWIIVSLASGVIAILSFIIIRDKIMKQKNKEDHQYSTSVSHEDSDSLDSTATGSTQEDHVYVSVPQENSDSLDAPEKVSPQFQPPIKDSITEKKQIKRESDPTSQSCYKGASVPIESSSYQHPDQEGILRKRKIPNEKQNKNKKLFGAVITGDLTMVQSAINEGLDVNYCDPDDGSTPMHAACWNGNLAIVEELIQAHANKDSRTNLGKSPLQYACAAGHLNVVQKLLDAGSDADTKDNYGITPLTAARRKGHKDVVKVLLQAGSKS